MSFDAPYREWQGREWQDYCLALLRVRYRDHQLQEVPDKDQGDLGIEAFTHGGAVFQCYAAEEPLSTKELYGKQRDKLTEDLNKLKNNAAKFEKLLGIVKIETYVFMVPRYSSKSIIEHAQTKAAEVRQWDLPFIADTFKIVVEDDSNYAIESNQVFAIPAQLMCNAPLTEEELDEWREDHSPMMKDATRKLRAIGFDGPTLSAALDTLLKQHLKGANTLAELRNKVPENWQALEMVKSTKETLLAIEYPPGSTQNATGMKAIMEELTAEILKAAPTVPDFSARDLAWAAVADWIFRCPLEFEVQP